MAKPIRPDAPRKVAKAATRAKIIAAAELMFRSVGYEAATMRAIAKLAGMSTGALFSSFSGKDELYREIHGHDPLSPEQGRELLAVLKGEAGWPKWLSAMAAQQAA